MRARRGRPFPEPGSAGSRSGASTTSSRASSSPSAASTCRAPVSRGPLRTTFRSSWTWRSRPRWRKRDPLGKMGPMRRPALPRKILLAAAIALAASATAARAKDAPSLPYCSATSLGGALAAFDSVLAGVDVVWEVEPNDVEKSALEAALRAEATRRGYVIGDEESKTRWVLMRRGPANEGLEEGEPPLTSAGNAAA